MTQSAKLALVLLALAFFASSKPRTPPKGPPPGGWPKPPPDEDLGVHPLPPNPLKKR